MNKVDQARNGAEAVHRFNDHLGACAPDRIQVRLDARDGMACLCEVENALAGLWPRSPAKELIWLTRAGAGAGDVDHLHLQAFSADGGVLGAASYRLRGDGG